MPKQRDEFGFIIGSKKSRAARIYMSNWTTTEYIKMTVGGAQLNLLFDVCAQGHRIQKAHTRTITGKLRDVYRIKLNEEHFNLGKKKIPKFDWETPSIKQFKAWGFHEMEVNEILSIWLIPFYFYKCVPEGTVTHYNFGKRAPWGDHVSEWVRFDGVKTHNQIGYLRAGLIAAQE